MITHLPLVARLAIGVAVTYVVSQQIISYYQNQPGADKCTSDSFLPVLINVGIALLIMIALVPPEPAQKPPA